MTRPENVMLWKPVADVRGYTTQREHLESVVRHIDHGRVDLARSVLLSMIGRKMAEETLLDGRITG
jgi:exonuclease VII small subunit